MEDPEALGEPEAAQDPPTDGVEELQANAGEPAAEEAPAAVEEPGATEEPDFSAPAAAQEPSSLAEQPAGSEEAVAAEEAPAAEQVESAEPGLEEAAAPNPEAPPEAEVGHPGRADESAPESAPAAEEAPAAAEEPEAAPAESAAARDESAAPEKAQAADESVPKAETAAPSPDEAPAEPTEAAPQKDESAPRPATGGSQAEAAAATAAAGSDLNSSLVPESELAMSGVHDTMSASGQTQHEDDSMMSSGMHGDLGSSVLMGSVLPMTPPEPGSGSMPIAPAGLGGDYDAGAFQQAPDLEVQHPYSFLPLTHILSLESFKRNNIAYIEDDVLVTSAGNAVVFIHLADMSQRYLAGLDGGGIGAFAVHPSRKFLAVAEKCRRRAPNVYIYQYPSLKLCKVLRNGTEQAYAALAFNDRGDTLGAVGGFSRLSVHAVELAGGGHRAALQGLLTGRVHREVLTLL